MHIICWQGSQLPAAACYDRTRTVWIFLALEGMEKQVLPPTLMPSEPPEAGVYVSGLQLHGASWDSQRLLLVESVAGGEELQSLPLIWLQPTELAEGSLTHPGHPHPDFRCPLYTTPEPELHSDANIVAHLPLASGKDAALWTQHRVFLSCIFQNYPSPE